MFAGKTDAQRKRRQASILAAQEAVAVKEAIETALEKEVEKQAETIPLTPYQWQAHVITVVGPNIIYLNKRLNKQDDDRFKAYELFKGRSLLDPYVTKNTSYKEAMELLETLRQYPVLNKEGKGNVVNRLKQG